MKCVQSLKQARTRWRVIAGTPPKSKWGYWRFAEGRLVGRWDTAGPQLVCSLTAQRCVGWDGEGIASPWMRQMGWEMGLCLRAPVWQQSLGLGECRKPDSCSHSVMRWQRAPVPLARGRTQGRHHQSTAGYWPASLEPVWKEHCWSWRGWFCLSFQPLSSLFGLLEQLKSCSNDLGSSVTQVPFLDWDQPRTSSSPSSL